MLTSGTSKLYGYFNISVILFKHAFVRGTLACLADLLFLSIEGDGGAGQFACHLNY